MKKSAFVVRSDIRNVVLCSLLAFGLAACGASEGSSSSGTASAASDSTPSLVSPSVGLVDRSSGTGTPSVVGTTATNVAANTTQSAAPGSASSTTPTSSSTTASTTTPAPTGTVPATGTKPAPSNNPSTGAVTLDWLPPTENIDGSLLTNLAGYTVYYGTSPDNLTQSLKITNPGLTAYTVSNLPSGTWYFAVTSSSSTGVESSLSGVVSTTI